VAISIAVSLLAGLLTTFPAVAAERLSGAVFMGPSTQAMQRDDSQNPAMLWVKDGETLWRRSDEGNGKSCASCHGDATTAMRGVAARYPAFDSQHKLPVNLGQRINQCRVRQQAAPLALDSEALLALESYIGLQSRGMPVAPPDDARLRVFLARGEQRWQQRMGQLNLSCAQCHDERAGQRLGSSVIPQGHATGYPIYRLEWQAMGSLQRRLRNCMSGVRAELFPTGSAELVELELYLAQRARGMPVETPAVRP
jgi:sulfur-oxidizing protein SoxA